MILQSNPKANFLAHRTEIESAIARVLASGWYVLGNEVKAFEQEFAKAMGTTWCIGVASGTDAIELALRALNICVGDRVLTVSHTAVATIAAIARTGALPVFVDIDPERFTMSPESLNLALNTDVGAQAKALIVVHLYGQVADMPNIMALAKAHNLAVIEDCAQAHDASLDGRPVGTWGDMGCFSFYPTKNLGALGDGGAVVGTNTTLGERIKSLREYGWHTRYISEHFGTNSRLDELQAAILRVKLPYLATENQQRRAIAKHYDDHLTGSSVIPPMVYRGCNHVFHQYVIRSDCRDDLQKSLQKLGVHTLIHYPKAVHQQPTFSNTALSPIPLPHTERVVNQILSLPMYPELDNTDVDTICSAVQQIISLH